MQIRFFATNRDRQNLGLNVDRDTRIKLLKFGYHWVDMKKYMAHYLATTDPSTMPPGVIIEDSEETVFNKFLKKGRKTHYHWHSWLQCSFSWGINFFFDFGRHP